MQGLKPIASQEGTPPFSPRSAGPPCPKCQAPMTKWIPGKPDPSCQPCWVAERDAAEAERWIAEADQWTQRACEFAGMSAREFRATMERIPLPIKRAMPKEQVLAMLRGQEPRRGFGLGGEGTGAGKTSAMAALLRDWLRAREVRRVRAGGPPPSPRDSILKWENWPTTVAWLRQNGTDPRLADVLETLKRIPVLFLDDLGSERIKGSYVEDFAASQLDAVVDARYRWERPTFYTTNLDLPGLVGFYGARLVSRLCGDNPLGTVSGLKDQRIAP